MPKLRNYTTSLHMLNKQTSVSSSSSPNNLTNFLPRMIAKSSLYITIVVSILTILIPRTAFAQGGITVQDKIQHSTTSVELERTGAKSGKGIFGVFKKNRSPKMVESQSINKRITNVQSASILEDDDREYPSDVIKPFGTKHRIIHNDKFHLVQTGLTNLIGWHKEDYTEVIKIYDQICDYVMKTSWHGNVKSQPKIGSVHDWRILCSEIKSYVSSSNDDIRRFFVSKFTAFAVINDTPKEKNDYKRLDGLFTGYYIPTIRGSTTKTLVFKYPVYSKPYSKADLQLTRKQITSGALSGRGLELFWTDDFVDLYDLHIQGSGNVTFTNGTTKRLVYAGRNTQKYSSAAQYAIKAKAYNTRSHISFNKFLYQDHERATRVLNSNKSYIFFSLSEDQDIRGAQGTPLHAERSIAVDNELMEYGFPMWITLANGSMSKILFAQDTGSAIKGKVRADIFFGAGKKAEIKARRTKHKGWYYILMPKTFTKYITHKR